MRSNRIVKSLIVLSIFAITSSSASARELTFEERVKAQEGIERVYYAHQVGATRPFEEAVPRSLIEHKVRTYLKESVALETLWHTRVTGGMLQKEVERMAARTRMPERLSDLFGALGNDSFVIQETLARASLVDRLARNFHATDERLHGSARRQAETLRQALRDGIIDPRTEDSRCNVVDVILENGTETAQAFPGARADIGFGVSSLRLREEEYARIESGMPGRVGEVGEIVEQRESFIIRKLLGQEAGRFSLAACSVVKEEWDSWWRGVAADLDEGSVRAVASDAPAPPAVSGISCSPDDSWDNGALGDLPDPRVGHTAVWTGSVMVVWGGGFQSLFNTGGRYDPATDSWSPTSTVEAPTKRTDHSAVWTGRHMVVWGGSDVSGFVNTGGRYDPVADSWEPISTINAPEARAGHTAVRAGKRMVVWGGYNGPYPHSPLNTGGRYDPGADRWTPTTTLNAPEGRFFHTSVIVRRRMVVWGGTDGSAFLNTGARYDAAKDVWTPTSQSGAPEARAYHTAVSSGRRMIVWGGLNGAVTPVNSGGRYDPIKDRWEPTSTTNAPVARGTHVALWTGKLMVVSGGQPTPAAYTITGGRYDPATDIWMSISTVNAPAYRFGHTAVWTGTRMVTWGGYGIDGEPLNTGGRYDPRHDAWTPTSTLMNPSPRYDHTAAWTGSLMIIWGGNMDFGPLNTGGRYDPALDSWSPTSTIGAPTGRYGYSAVWTGSQLVVWGGVGHNPNPTGPGDFYLYSNAGARYDPLTDVWTSMPTDNAPAGRAWHTVTWTGGEIVVWGGFSGSASLGTGGRYDPTTDVWSPTSATNAPTARYGHTAISTGAQMVVWGGYGIDGEPLNTGGRYDPSSDTWLPTATQGAPTGRSGHSAIWTGSRMIIWGGQSVSGVSFLTLNTGALYDPENDSWASTSMTDAPDVRLSHTAVWTGGLMVVWGGANDFGIPQPGGRYDPQGEAWTPTSTINAPVGRRSHTAIWTGDQMVVWGGTAGRAMNTGGRYCVAP